eukprot:6171894-Pleurochrysis_carterae.AAC.1
MAQALTRARAQAQSGGACLQAQAHACARACKCTTFARAHEREQGGARLDAPIREHLPRVCGLHAGTDALVHAQKRLRANACTHTRTLALAHALSHDRTHNAL